MVHKLQVINGQVFFKLYSIPTDLDRQVVNLSICGFQFRFLSITTPRYLTLSFWHFNCYLYECLSFSIENL